MDIWNLLGIDVTSDTRTIKRAYASKLKVTRPDEHPEAFQELHYAYKTALNYALSEQEQEHQQSNPPDGYTAHTALDHEESQAQYHAPESDSLLVESNQQRVTKQPSIPPTDAQEPRSTNDAPDTETSPQQTEVENNPYQYEGERLVALAQVLLNTQNELHAPESWEFLLHSPYILDDQFNWRLGLEILRLIQAHNQQCANKPLMLIGAGVMTYLDTLFNWKLNRYHIVRFLNEDEFSPLLDKIAEQEPLQQTQHALDGLRGAKSIKVIETQKQPNTLYYASPIKRFIALLIDMAGMFIIASLILNDLSNNATQMHNKTMEPEAGLIITMILGFIYFWACECSSVQATLGKLIMGLIVTNKDFERMTSLQGFWRSLVFSLSSLLTYIVLIINAMMGDKLLHDRITKTYVIDIRRSRQQ